MTRVGTLRGRRGSVKGGCPCSRPLDFGAVFRIEGGKIAEWWVTWDLRHVIFSLWCISANHRLGITQTGTVSPSRPNLLPAGLSRETPRADSAPARTSAVARLDQGRWHGAMRNSDARHYPSNRGSYTYKTEQKGCASSERCRESATSS
jgi:hypothetical protein